MAYPGMPGAMPGVMAGGAYYPGFGPPAGGYPQNDPMYGYFLQIAGQDGQLDAEELQRCLTQAGMSGTYKPFNLETCRLMISMLDRDMTGKMGFNEFKELGMVLNGWKQSFMAADISRSGTVDGMELHRALTTMGFRLSQQTMNLLQRRYSIHGRIAFDNYIACCVKLRALTELFRRRDAVNQGMVNFMYDDFIMSVMSI
ncbi:sorcin [Hyperolius riggenbachi]|uniref:sorcin n=1 Tax=Hyperolius riggenbachi TaxID=752182 RepID=UPI0035A3941E